jgi:hypothetical protein
VCLCALKSEYVYEYVYVQVFMYLCMQLQTASVVYWSEFLATDLEVRVRFPALPDFLRSSGSGTGVHSASSVQLMSYLEEKVAAPV